MPQKYNFLIAFDVFLLVAHFLLNVVHWVPTKHYQHVLHVNFMYCRRRNNWAIPISTCCIKGVSNNITSSILMTYWLLLTETCVKVPQKVCGCFYVALCACMQALPRSIQERIVRKHRNNEKSFFFLFILLFPVYIVYCFGSYWFIGYSYLTLYTGNMQGSCIERKWQLLNASFSSSLHINLLPLCDVSMCTMYIHNPIKFLLPRWL